MFVDPFSNEYLQSSFDERAAMYADSWFDQDEDAPSAVYSREHNVVELVDDLPF